MDAGQTYSIQWKLKTHTMANSTVIVIGIIILEVITFAGGYWFAMEVWHREMKEDLEKKRSETFRKN